jgi:NADH-quinone oxidoreductase subunit K
VHLLGPVILATVLAGAGIYGILARRNAVLSLIGIELVLNSANLVLVAFDAAYRDQLHGGQVLAIFLITVAAAEIVIALAVILLIFRRVGQVDLVQLRSLAESADQPGEP